ncbi:v-maf avian musculoaponeurotic fibrosarcoma oncogene homolog Ga isoform X1 [Tachysurus ichikawai]
MHALGIPSGPGVSHFSPQPGVRILEHLLLGGGRVRFPPASLNAADSSLKDALPFDGIYGAGCGDSLYPLVQHKRAGGGEVHLVWNRNHERV